MRRRITAEKLRMYRRGMWSCPVPPVCTAEWTDHSWVFWIDSRGKWIPPKEDVDDTVNFHR